MILRAIADLPFKSDNLQYIYFKDERGEKECGRAVIQSEWKDQRLKIEINEVLPSDKSKTNDPGYLLSNRPWNKTSGRDIITKSQHPVSTAKEVRLYATIYHRTCFVTFAS